MAPRVQSGRSPVPVGAGTWITAAWYPAAGCPRVGSVTTTTSSATAAPPRAALTPFGLFTLLLGAALPMIDFFVVNVALPTIEHDLDASPATLEMVVAGYAVAYAVLLVLGGRLGDTFGRRRLFLWGVAGFGL
ncbi:MFS transporter, partial [Streptomyces sp. WELS2]|uniref:MFS transporter n=1 Tax=Streptomyces sp. WELS2 TaxID=2749435 RepID=UPI0015F0598F